MLLASMIVMLGSEGWGLSEDLQNGQIVWLLSIKAEQRQRINVKLITSLP